ncbi:MAG TPA: threonylcarbamoyl-AMP synthase [bacterium]|nr:threonylcarbamoyl-AMP synthase [bacterium]
MSQYFRIHPDNPQPRLIRQAVDFIRDGGVIVYPTDSGYALGCHIGDKSAKARMIRIRRLDEQHRFTLMCRDLKEAAVYARFDTPVFRLLRAVTPGPYTFILEATREVPRRLLNPKRRTIGLRIPDHAIVLALLGELGEPLLTSTLILPDEEYPVSDPDEIRVRLHKEVDLIIDGGSGGTIPTTVVNLMEDPPVLMRRGKGDPTPFL